MKNAKSATDILFVLNALHDDVMRKKKKRPKDIFLFQEVILDQMIKEDLISNPGYVADQISKGWGFVLLQVVGCVGGRIELLHPGVYVSIDEVCLVRCERDKEEVSKCMDKK